MISIDEFRAALATFAAGVTVVTSMDADGHPVGATVSAFASVSADPPLVLVCLKTSTRSAQAVHHAGSFTVHILCRDHVELAQRFATDHSEKFAGLPFHLGANGCPAIDECTVRLECEVASETPGGTHTVFIGSVMSAAVEEIKPLIYANRKFMEPAELDAVSLAG